MAQEKLVKGKAIIQEVLGERKIVRVYVSEKERIDKDFRMLNIIKSCDVKLFIEDVDVIIQEFDNLPFSAQF